METQTLQSRQTKHLIETGLEDILTSITKQKFVICGKAVIILAADDSQNRIRNNSKLKLLRKIFRRGPFLEVKDLITSATL